MIPYGKQTITDDDVRAVVKVLQSDWLTTGPSVRLFEEKVAEFVGAKHGVAVANGTAALHCALYAMGVEPGDEVVVPAMTFAASANSVVFLGATPVFADVDPETLLIDLADVERKITDKTKVVIGVDYAGQPCNWDGLRKIADRYGVQLLADACHALGAHYKSKPVGSLADASVFSFHPVKHVATGEGGMVVTGDSELARKAGLFRSHGITTDARQREEQGSWFYEMVDLGYNYRITDIQCALGISQMAQLDGFLARRREIASRYDAVFADVDGIEPLALKSESLHAYHLYVIRVVGDGLDRADMFRSLREQGVGSNVHYIPVYLHPYYKDRFGLDSGLCPHAEAAYEQILSIPMYPGLTDEEVTTVCKAVAGYVGR